MLKQWWKYENTRPDWFAGPLAWFGWTVTLTILLYGVWLTLGL